MVVFLYIDSLFSLLMKVAKQGRVNFPQREYATNLSFSQIPERKNQIKG